MSESYKVYASQEYVNSTVDVVLDSANAYTDAQIAEIPAPDVSGQINEHNADTQAHADIRAALSNKSDTSHVHTVSNISDLTATATELNYMDGVTSNVQTQIDSLKSSLTTEQWTFTLEDGSTVTKAVHVG